jgi:hypothetical protein
MRTLTAVLALTLAACGSGDPDDKVTAGPTSASPGQEYILGYAETLRLQGGVTLEFTTLAEDSRCPSNVTCVWEGNARILVTMTTAHGSSVLELNTSSRFAARATFDGYLVEFRKLEPVPVAGAPTGASAYEATLFVDLAASSGNGG